MKRLSLVCFLAVASFGLAAAQTVPSATETPAASPTASSAATVRPVPSVTAAAATATASVSAEAGEGDDLGDRIEAKVRKHLQKGSEKHHGVHINDGSEWMAVPIVMIVFLAIFGAPVAVVGVIMYFSMSKTRALHRTVRMMVEKGQEVPAALLNPPPAQRQRSDMRRGVILMMVGLGIMLFLGACNDWEGGAWALGIIPFLIGAGYLLVWKLEAQKKDNPPPLP